MMPWGSLDTLGQLPNGGAVTPGAGQWGSLDTLGQITNGGAVTPGAG